MEKLNCWEVMKCGREPGGANVKELGICPATTDARVDGLNYGKNAGRCCWAIAGTFCEGKVQGVFASKLASCMHCKFFQAVAKEEGADFKTAKDVLDKITRVEKEKEKPKEK